MTKCKLITKRVVKCSNEIYKQLYSLNFRKYSLMRIALVNARIYDTGWVSYILEGKKVIAWSIVYKHKNDPQKNECKYRVTSPDTFEAHFYVRKNYRNNGLGKKLYLVSKKICSDNCKRMRITRHDEISKSFFKKVRSL